MTKYEFAERIHICKDNKRFVVISNKKENDLLVKKLKDLFYIKGFETVDCNVKSPHEYPCVVELSTLTTSKDSGRRYAEELYSLVKDDCFKSRGWNGDLLHYGVAMRYSFAYVSFDLIFRDIKSSDPFTIPIEEYKNSLR